VESKHTHQIGILVPLFVNKQYITEHCNFLPNPAPALVAGFEDIYLGPDLQNVLRFVPRLSINQSINQSKTRHKTFLKT